MTRTDAPPAPRRWTDTWAAPAVVAAAAAAALAPSLPGGFVADDRSSILDNPLVMRPGSPARVLTGAFGPDPFGYTRPLRTIEFAADHALFGDGPASYRVHSLLWHLVACVLLLFVLRRFLGDTRAAFAGALLWAIHPVQVESVAWISARGDVAMGACSLLAVLFALRSRGYDRDLAASLAAAAAAALYKETAVLVPALVLVLRWTKLCRAPWAPFVGVSAAFALWRALDHASLVSDFGFVLGGSTQGTLATSARAFGFYVVETLLPANSFDWYMPPSRSFDETAVTAWLLVHAALVLSAVLAWRRAPLWTVSVAWFYVFLLPVANWPFSVGKPTSERYMYLSLAGAALAAGWALVRAPRWIWPATIAAAAAFGVQSFERSKTWLSDDAQYRAVLADHDSPGARYYFAVTALAEATDLVRRAQAMPEGPARVETTSQARAGLERALEQVHAAIAVWRAYDPTSPPRSKLLRRFEVVAASCCYRLLRHQEALFHAEEVLRIDPTLDAYAEYGRAMPLLALGFAPQAAEAMKRALRLGFPAPNEEIAGFFVRAGARCESDGLRVAAEDCYAAAVESAPAGPRKSEAQARLFALRRRPWAASAAAEERVTSARLDEELARLPRSCPVRAAASSQ